MTWSFVWSGSQQIHRFYFSRDFSFWCESEGNQIKERVSYYVSIKWSYPYLWYNREKPAETQLLNLWENEVEKFILCKYWGIDSGVRKKWAKEKNRKWDTLHITQNTFYRIYLRAGTYICTVQCTMVPLSTRMLLWSKFSMNFGKLLQEHSIQN